MKKTMLFLLISAISTNIFAATDNSKLQNELRYKLNGKEISFTQVFRQYGHENYVYNELARVKSTYDYDKDGLLDYYEVFRNFTNPELKDTDGDGILDGDWKERQENCYSLEVEVEIIKPFKVDDMIDDYQDIISYKEKEKTGVFKLILYPEYDQKITKTINLEKDELTIDNKYLLSGDTISFDEYMKNDIKSYLSNIKTYKDNVINGKLIDDSMVIEYCKLVMNNKHKVISLNDKGIFSKLPYKDGKPDINKIKKDPNMSKIFQDDDNFRRNFSNLSLEKTYNLFFSTSNAYRNRVILNCTSIASMETAIGRVLNVPSRIALSIPLFSEGDKSKLNSNDFTNRKIYEGFFNEDGSLTADLSDHFYPEYFIGNQWVNFENTQKQAFIKIIALADLTELNNYESWMNSQFNKGIMKVISVKENNPINKVNK